MSMATGSNLSMYAKIVAVCAANFITSFRIMIITYTKTYPRSKHKPRKTNKERYKSVANRSAKYFNDPILSNSLLEILRNGHRCFHSRRDPSKHDFSRNETKPPKTITKCQGCYCTRTCRI